MPSKSLSNDTPIISLVRDVLEHICPRSERRSRSKVKIPDEHSYAFWKLDRIAGHVGKDINRPMMLELIAHVGDKLSLDSHDVVLMSLTDFVSEIDKLESVEHAIGGNLQRDLKRSNELQLVDARSYHHANVNRTWDDFPRWMSTRSASDHFTDKKYLGKLRKMTISELKAEVTRCRRHKYPRRAK